MAQGGTIFTMLEMEEQDFCYIYECIIYLGVMFGSISPPCGNPLVLASLLSVLSLHILWEQLTQNVLNVSRHLTGAPLPLPAYVWEKCHLFISTYSNNIAPTYQV